MVLEVSLGPRNSSGETTFFYTCFSEKAKAFPTPTIPYNQALQLAKTGHQRGNNKENGR